MKKCAICGKGYIKTITLKKLRGKYNPTSKNRRLPNLQWAKFSENVAKKFGLSAKKRVKACTKCIKKFSNL